MAEEEATPAAPTKRVVLKREQALILGDGVTLAQIAECANEKALRKLLVSRATTPAEYEVEAWVVIGTGQGSKTQAIESHAGKPGTPDAKQGAYKAPSASSWAGGELYDAPPLPLVERRPLEDAA